MAVTTLNSTALLYAASTEATYAAAREGGNGRYVSEFGWIGQYYGGGPFEVNQVFARFDLSSLPANALITSAKLIVTARESYGNHTVEVRSSAFTPSDATSFVPGSGLAAKTLLGSTAFADGFDFERQIVLSGFTRENLASLVLAGAAQRTGTAPTGDTTTRIDSAKLEVTYVLAEYLTTTGAGTWTVPAGVTNITVTVQGAGASGSGQNAIGGGSGGMSTKALIVAPGASIAYSIGVGGAVVSGLIGAGGNTWFNSTTTVLANGGRAQFQNTGPGGSTTGAYGDTVVAGVDSTTATGVNGRNSPYGGVGGVGYPNVTPGLVGGVGAGGGCSFNGPGRGGRGEIRITWDTSTAPPASSRRAPRSFYWL